MFFGDTIFWFVAPSGKNVLKKIESIGKGKYQVEYTPFEPGDHQIMVSYCDQPVKGGPFSCKAYDAGQVIVKHMPSLASINQPVSFNIDASEAGSGNIEILVNKGRIACSVQNLGSYKFLASFIPTKVEKHTIEMKFNNLPVVGSPWHVEVTDPKSISVSGRGLDFVLVNRIENFVVNCGENMSKNINVSITGNHDDGIAHPVNTCLILSCFSFCRASVYNCLLFIRFVLFFTTNCTTYHIHC